VIIQQIENLILKLKKRGFNILLVAQNLTFASKVANGTTLCRKAPWWTSRISINSTITKKS